MKKTRKNAAFCVFVCTFGSINQNYNETILLFGLAGMCHDVGIGRRE